jgi:hypothetical protein
MADREVDRKLRYRVLQNELRIILSYLRTADADGLLQLDAKKLRRHGQAIVKSWPAVCPPDQTARRGGRSRATGW